jgi:SAM-dependent methyltransferase
MIGYLPRACLFCGDTRCADEEYPRNFRDEDLTPAVFSARRVTEHFHYRMLRCRRTGLLFSAEILPEDALERLYAGSQVTFSAYADILRADYWRPLESRLAALSPGRSRGAALEIGCSSGFFLEELKQRGFGDVRGCEPSREAKERASPEVRAGIRTGFFNDSAYPDGSFDLICAFQTLDHVADPLSVLRTCLAKLKPGGLIYLIVHDTGALQARLFGEKSPIIDVEHIYLFNRRTLPMAAAKAGFEAPEIFPIRNSYPLEYWVTHAPIPFRATVHAALKAAGLHSLRVPLRAGNIGLVARKPR